jgi:hypothetical protein
MSFEQNYRRCLDIIIAAAIACLLAASSQAQPRRIYLANDDHTDFMWPADADTYANVFVEMLDWHLKLADETATNAPAYRNRFNCDGSYWLWNYEQKKTPAEFARLIERIKDGTISAPLNTVVSCYGGQPVEAVLRGMYYAGRLERRYGLRFPLAVAMENQTLPLGLASLFAGSGARYSWRGICNCATRLDKKALGERPREIYWWTGHDGLRVLLKWYSAGPHNLGTYPEAGSPLSILKFVETDEGFLRRYTDPRTREPYRGAVNLNKLKSAGGDYADTHARYDYLTVNHFADLTDGSDQKGVTISNPDLAFAKLGRSTVTNLDTATPQLQMLAGGQVDGSSLGIPRQNSHTHFLQRFALRPHGGYDPVAAMKFALEHQNPFVTGAVISQTGGAYPGTNYSLLTVSNANVLLWAFKLHDDGLEHGLVARLWNLSDTPATAEIAFAPGLTAAHRTTHIETALEAVPLTGAGALPATFTRQQMQTYRLKLK